MSIYHLICVRINSYILNFLDTNEKLAIHQEIFFKLMLLIYKPWIKNVDEFLDKSMRNPKDSFSSHLCEYMSDEEFPKATMMKILRANISLDFHRIEETIFLY